jgi:hypothetical protein
MLAVTPSELLLRDHCISRHFKFKTYQRYQSLYLPNIIFLALCFFKFKGQNRKNIVLYSFYKPFCRTCLLYSTRRCAPRALKNVCDKIVSYKTRIINYYFHFEVLVFKLCNSSHQCGRQKNLQKQKIIYCEKLPERIENHNYTRKTNNEILYHVSGWCGICCYGFTCEVHVSTTM